MRKIYICFPLLILSVSAFSQTNCRVMIKNEFAGNNLCVSGLTISPDTSKKEIRWRCRAASTTSSNEPLIIVDGIPIENKSIASLNPSDIESIEVLKDVAALALCGGRGYAGVIIITTKAKSGFVVKDFLTGTSIAFATVVFTSVKNIKDTLAFIADDNGIVVTDKLKAGEKYSVKVTSVGYKGYHTNYKRVNKRQEFLLERDVVLNSEVVVTNTYCPRRISCGFTVTKISHSPSLIDSVSSVRVKSTVFPNPVQRGSSFSVELNGVEEKSISITILDAGGRQVKAQSIQTVKGINKFSINTDSRWAAGIYFIKLENEQQRLIKTEQIVIQ
ncbi:MAG TPA: T9SS type A sorting domain-containing protein [Chitinophagaceae bacterium]